MLERALKHAPVVRRVEMMQGVLASFEGATGSNDAYAGARSDLVRFDA